MTDNPSDDAESVQANFVEHERQQRFAKAKTVEATIATWSNFNTKLGLFADEHSTL